MRPRYVFNSGLLSTESGFRSARFLARDIGIGLEIEESYNGIKRRDRVFVGFRHNGKHNLSLFTKPEAVVKYSKALLKRIN
jgi:hypothetical protein